MYQAILEDVQEIIAVYLYIDRQEVTPDADLRQDLGMDSLDLVELTMVFEKTFGSTCRRDARRSMTTVGEVVEYLVAIGAVSPRYQSPEPTLSAWAHQPVEAL
jgi:acyl carrier protein